MFNFFTNFFDNLSGRQRLFALVIVATLLALLLSLWTKGLQATFLVTISVVVVLLITNRIWLPENYGKATIRRYSLWVVLATAGSFWGWNSLVEAYIVSPLFKYLQNEFPKLRDYQLLDSTPSIIVLLFVLMGVLIVNYFMRDQTAMKEHPIPIEKEFPEKEYKKRLKAFCEVLLHDLKKIDLETNWSTEYFTPLEAEVEVQYKNKRKRRITDLLSAIRADHKSRVTLVLGDPGAGKSVALRKLCQDLLKEVDKTGKVPIYINLREWEAEKTWTEKTPPTSQQLYDFVLSNLKGRTDIFANEFLDHYFKKMFDNGRLYFVLDSFDEIPTVLDVDESSWLIDKLSHVIYLFLAGAHESRGILASRIFRRPTHSFQCTTVLEIRPFSEWKIIEYLKKSMSYDEKLAEELFGRHQELVPAARNPFCAALISNYAKEHNNTLPENQAELYSSYIHSRLKSCKARIEKKNLSSDEILACAIDIANQMFLTPSFGLETSIQELEKRIPQHPVSDVVDILRYARLARLGMGEEQHFSFSHRRFNEYFVAQKFILEPQRVLPQSIPTDSRWRDALVLYCEVADATEVEKIAASCWSEISRITNNKLELNDPQYLRAMHSLRFLKEAFRSRLESIASFRDQLATFVKNQIANDSDLLAIKLSTEAVGILDEKEIDSTISKALSIRNEWISETALKACRHLPKISKNLERKMMEYIDSLNLLAFFKRRHEFLFSFKLSSGFRNIYTYCKWLIIDSYLFFVGTLIAFALNPLFVALAMFTAAIVSWTAPIINPVFERLFTASKLRNVIVKIVSWLKLDQREDSRGTARVTADESIGMFRLMAILSLLMWTMTSHIKKSLDEYMGYVPNLFSGLTPPFDLWVPLIISIVFLVSWPSLYIILPSLFEILIVRWKSLAAVWVIYAPLLILYWLLVHALHISIESIVTFLIMPLFAIGVITISIREIIFYHHDKKLFQWVKNSSIISREDISKIFDKFKYPRWRLRFVQFLLSNNIKIEGEWPDGKVPNFRNDLASTLLAQAEERRLGLDR